MNHKAAKWRQLPEQSALTVGSLVYWAGEDAEA